MSSNIDESNFHRVVRTSLSKRGLQIADVCDVDDAVERRILQEYGAIFLAASSVVVPPKCIFADAASVNEFQAALHIESANINGVNIELQAAAMRSLLAARREAIQNDLDITPRGGAEAARRTFEDTVRLWNSRVFPALEFWLANKRITVETAENLPKLPLREQVKAVLELERDGVFFSKDFARTILTSVAAPGASQHLALLAFDAEQFFDQTARRILARHGWFRTVRDDLPHFTFLGRAENELPALGLQLVETKFGEFWLPQIDFQSSEPAKFSLTK